MKIKKRLFFMADTVTYHTCLVHAVICRNFLMKAITQIVNAKEINIATQQQKRDL
jgi:hypothetical protein